MKDKVKELFDSVTPLWSDEELINNTLRKVETMENNENRRKKRFVKPLAAVCAAVAVMAAGTITVGAVYNWDLSGFFKHAHSISANDTAIEKMDNVDFSRFGMPLDDVIEFEGGRVKMEAVLLDKMNVEFLYTVEFDEPEKFKGYNPVLYADISKVDKESGDSERSNLGWTHNSEMIDDVIYQYMSAGFEQEATNDHYIRFSVTEMHAYRAVFDEESGAYITDEWLSLPLIGNTEILIDAGSALDETVVRTASGYYEVNAYDLTLVIDSVRLSPLALNFVTPANAESDSLFDINQMIWSEGSPAEFAGFFKVKMSDGSVISINDGGAGATDRDDGSVMYDVPILPVDTSSAVAVIIGETEIPLD